MNPAVLNYLQSQQMNDQGNDQGNGVNNPPFNPFNSGIKNAIESARVSLDMTEKQQDKALRRSMLTFGNSYANEPRKRGFMANFGSVSRALSPAIMAHDESEDMAFKENNALANQILAYDAAEQDRQSREEEKAFRRQHAQEQLDEQRRYHDLMSDYKHQKLNSQQNADSNEPLTLNGIEVFPIQSKKEYTDYTKAKTALGTVLHEVENLEKDYTKFRKDTSQDWFDPMAQGSSITNTTKDYFGRFLNNKKLKEETADRETLVSKLNKFVVSSERSLKGGGTMGPRLIELFKEQKIYPSLDEDTPEIFESKLKMLKEEIENSYKAANLSLSHRVHIDPSQVKDIENASQKDLGEDDIEGEDDINNVAALAKLPIQNEPENPQVMLMKDQNGNVFNIPLNEIEEAMNDGFVPSER